MTRRLHAKRRTWFTLAATLLAGAGLHAVAADPRPPTDRRRPQRPPLREVPQVERRPGASDVPQVYIYSAPQWAKRWVRNFRAAGRPPFGTLIVKAALTYPKSDSVDHVIEACRELDRVDWPYIVGLSHFGQRKYEDWFDESFWQHVAGELRRLEPVVRSDRLFVFDFEPYRLKGKRYPRQFDAQELSLGMAPLIEEIKRQKLRVAVLQGDLAHMYLWLMAANDIEVILLDKAVDRAPYGQPDWQKTMVERHRAARAAGMDLIPVFYAAALTPEFQQTIAEMRLPAYGLFFAGQDQDDIPGASTREDYYNFGLLGWDPHRGATRPRGDRP